MKKGVLNLSVLFIGVCSSFVIWYGVNSDKITVVESGSRAWIISYDKVEDLEKAPDIDLIIKGTVTSKTQPRLIVGNTPSNPPLQYWAMVTSVQIDEILRADHRIADQITVDILEPTYIKNNDSLFQPGKTEFPLNNYLKALPGRSYIFYLSWNEKQQAYWVHGDHQGKFNIDDKDERELSFELGNHSYQSLKQSVLEKYKQAK